MKKIVALVCLTVFLFNCGSSNKVTTRKPKTKKITVTENGETRTETVIVKETETKVPVLKETPEVYANASEEYIAIFSDIAKDEMLQYGVPASITLAQGILESGSGKGRLASEANNHFGIKCHSGWTGGKIYHDDDTSQECFRKYKNSKYSFRDHSLFLKERKRYATLFTFGQDDYKAWAKGLRKAGYATDRKYPQKLISIIERYQLYRFDNEVLGTDKGVNDKHVVAVGDTMYSLSRQYEISLETLKELNGLESNTLFVGQILYIKPLPKD